MIAIVDDTTDSTGARAEPTTPAANGTIAKPAKRRGRVRFAAIVAWAIIVVAVAGAVFFGFQGPVADVWYSTRQRQLVSQYGSPGAHAGTGKAIALLQIPKLGQTYAVAEGDAAPQLRSGPGHRVGTPLPGRRGNSVVLGHRSAFGGPFAQLDQLEGGDYVIVQFYGPDAVPVNGVYTVKQKYTTSSGDVRPFANSTDYRLTLVTGSGGRLSKGRLVIEAVSGNTGKTMPVPAGTRSTTLVPAAANRDAMLLATAGFGGAAIISVAFRRRYRLPARLVVAVPLVVLGTIGLLLRVDVLLPPVR